MRMDEADDNKALRVVDTRSVKVYLKAGGCRCLYCGYEGVDGGDMDIEEGGATQKVRCPRCGGEWFDVHRLSGVMGVDGMDLTARRKKRRG